MTDSAWGLNGSWTTRFVLFGSPSFVRDLFSIESYLDGSDGLDEEPSEGALRTFIEGLCWILVARSGVIGLFGMVIPTFLAKEVLDFSRQGDWILLVGFGAMMGEVAVGLYLSAIRLRIRRIGVDRAMRAYRWASTVWPLGGAGAVIAVLLCGFA